MTKTIKNRLDALESSRPLAADPHDWNQVIKWDPDDRIYSRYYKDGVEIPERQYRQEHPHRPGDPIKVNIRWAEVTNDKNAKA